MLITLKSALRKIYKRAGRKWSAGAHDRWLYGQFIPLQSLNRTLLEYDVTFYDEDEIYQPNSADSPYPTRYRELDLHYHPIAIPRPYYFSIPNAVTSRYDVIDIDNPTRVFLETYPEVTQFVEGSNHTFNILNRKKALSYAARNKPTFENAYWFGTRAWKNYYHFIFDCCLRYVDLQKTGAIDDNTDILVFSEPTTFQRSYMNLLGIPDERIKTCNSGPVRITNLIISASRRQRFACSKKAIHSFSNKILSSIDYSKSRSPKRKIYISRALAKLRNVKNEADVVALLAECGFETVTLETMPIAEQVALIREAEVIVAPHGAGLANLVFAQNPKVVELIPYDSWGWGYYVPVTHAVGGTHIPIVGTRGLDEDDFTVDLDELRRAVLSDF